MEIVKHKQKNKKVIILIAVFLIILNTAIIFVMFNKKIAPNIEIVAQNKVKNMTYGMIIDNTMLSSKNSVKFDDILNLTQNNNGQIVYVDYNLEEAYILLNEITKNIKEGITNIQKGNINDNYVDYYLHKNKDNLYLDIPIGLVFKSPFLKNIGPKIPIKVTFSNYLITNLKTKITNYGINNALTELYVYIRLDTQIITPIDVKEDKFEYEVLIAAKMVNGEVPSIYGGSLEKQSSLINIPLN